MGYNKLTLLQYVPQHVGEGALNYTCLQQDFLFLPLSSLVGCIIETHHHFLQDKVTSPTLCPMDQNIPSTTQNNITTTRCCLSTHEPSYLQWNIQHIKIALFL